MNRMKQASGGALPRDNVYVLRSRSVGNVDNASLNDINNAPAPKRALVSPSAELAARREIALGVVNRLSPHGLQRNAAHCVVPMILGTRSAAFPATAIQTGKAASRHTALAATFASMSLVAAKTYSIASSWNRFLAGAWNAMSRSITRTASVMTTVLRILNCGIGRNRRAYGQASDRIAPLAAVYKRRLHVGLVELASG